MDFENIVNNELGYCGYALIIQPLVSHGGVTRYDSRTRK